jgi:hypothetical protein
MIARAADVATSASAPDPQACYDVLKDYEPAPW